VTSSRLRQLLTLGGVVALVLGVALVVVPREPGGGSAEVGFLQDLISHDAAALDLLDSPFASELGASAALIDGWSATIAAADGGAASILESWNQPPTTAREALAWMGHMPVGTTPGGIDPAAISALATQTDDDKVIGVLTAMSAHSRGVVLMARGLLGLASDDDTRRFAESVIAERNGIVADIDRWFLERGLLAPVWIAPMTIDPGQLDHGDPIGSTKAVLDNSLRWLMLSIGLFLVAVVSAGRRVGLRFPKPPVLVVAASASWLAGLGHMAIAGVHSDDSAIAGAFFVVAGGSQIAAGAVVAAKQSAASLNTLATLSLFMTTVYLVFRVVPPPGSVGPADVDLTGIIIVGLQLLAVAVWAARPITGEPSGWGADALVGLVVRGAAPAAVVAITGVTLLAGFTVGMRDSFAPSEVDVGFASDMIVHHDQAVQMAQIVTGRLSNPIVETFASEVIMTQRFEIGVFQTRLRGWGIGSAPPGEATMDWMGMAMPLREMPGIASDAQLAVLRQTDGEELDGLFLSMLAAHHVGGVQMAAFAAENADDERIAALASRIAVGQQTEIVEYRNSLNGLGLSLPSTAMSFDELLEVAEVAQ